MAGAGYKLFNTGDVLTAAQVNTYLQEQVVMRFANATARTTALASVLAEGMVSYLQDTDAVEVYNGTAWVGVATGDITGVTAGTGISGGGTSGTVTITNSMATEITAAGDIIVGTGSGTFDNLPIGTTGQVLTADTTVSPYKVKWATASSTPTAQAVSVWKNGVMSLTSGAYTTFTFDQEYYDTDGFHSTTTNTSRLTVPSGLGGKYYISFNFKCGTSSASEFTPRILVNGNAANDYNGKTTGNSEARFFTGVLAWNLSAGDYVEFAVYHAFGSSVNAEVDNGRGHFQMFRIGA